MFILSCSQPLVAAPPRSSEPLFPCHSQITICFSESWLLRIMAGTPQEIAHSASLPHDRLYLSALVAALFTVPCSSPAPAPAPAPCCCCLDRKLKCLLQQASAYHVCIPCWQCKPTVCIIKIAWQTNFFSTIHQP